MNIDEIRSENERRKEVRARATQGRWAHGKANDNEIVLPKSIPHYASGLMLVSCCNTWLAECKGNPDFIAYSANDNAAATIDFLLARIDELEKGVGE